MNCLSVLPQVRLTYLDTREHPFNLKGGGAAMGFFRVKICFSHFVAQREIVLETSCRDIYMYSLFIMFFKAAQQVSFLV